MNMDIETLFTYRYPETVSDLHLTPGSRPIIRDNGILRELEEYPTLTPKDTEIAIRMLLSEQQFKKLEKTGEVDFSRFFESSGIHARINAYKQRGTYAAALTAAETGHLVISTLHTIGAAQTIERIIDVFPASQQQQVRVQLASVLRCIISQQLVPRIDGNGRVLATEILISNPSVRNLILQDKTNKIQNVMLTHTKDGMQTLDMCLIGLMRRGIISAQSALTYCVEPDRMMREVKIVQPAINFV